MAELTLALTTCVVLAYCFNIIQHMQVINISRNLHHDDIHWFLHCFYIVFFTWTFMDIGHLTAMSSECLKHFSVIGIMSEHIIFHWVWQGRQCLETRCVHSLSPNPNFFFFFFPEADGTKKIGSAASAQMLFYGLISEVTSPSYQYVVSDKCCFCCCCFCHLQFWVSDCSLL